MKKYFIALLFGISLMSMQSASAATLTLTEIGSTAGALEDGPGSLIHGSTLTSGFWTIAISDLAPGELVDLIFTPTSAVIGGLAGVSTGLANGAIAVLAIVGQTDFTLGTAPSSVGQVPVPAAVWLFGSALLGLVGVTGRKSRPALTA